MELIRPQLIRPLLHIQAGGRISRPPPFLIGPPHKWADCGRIWADGRISFLSLSFNEWNAPCTPCYSGRFAGSDAKCVQ